MERLIDLSQPSLYVSAASIIFNPTFWNIAARQEYHNKVITNLFNGSKLSGCYALAMVIFSIGIIRDILYARALEAQPAHPLLQTPLAKYVAYGLLGVGNTLVLSSMWALGITGTYLGDYFGILMDKMVTGFPFNVVNSPMYVGSTISFIGTAVLYGRPAGFAISALVWTCYWVALQFEDPFTAEIYAKRERSRKAAGKKRQ